MLTKEDVLQTFKELDIPVSVVETHSAIVMIFDGGVDNSDIQLVLTKSTSTVCMFVDFWINAEDWNFSDTDGIRCTAMDELKCIFNDVVKPFLE